MLDFTIDNLAFLAVFGSYIAFFGLAFGVSHAIDQLIEKKK